MITTIPQNHCRIIERFGKPVKVQYSGLAFKLPMIDHVRDVSAEWGNETNKEGVFIELSEQIVDTKPRECITRDNAKVTVDCVLSWRVADPIKALYEVDHLHQSLLQTAMNLIRSEIGSRDLDDALATRSTLNERIVSGLSDTVKKWGIQILRVEIQELRTDDQTSAAMLQQLEAERRSRAFSSEADGKAQATVKGATADRERSSKRPRASQRRWRSQRLPRKSILIGWQKPLDLKKQRNSCWLRRFSMAMTGSLRTQRTRSSYHRV